MIAIVDYGMGNLRSVQKALERCGADARITSSPLEISHAEKVVLPGVGAFGDAMDALRTTGTHDAVLDAIDDDRPFLGICLGYQMLFDLSYEEGEHTGLGVMAGKVVRFDFASVGQPAGLKVPHMGWNQIDVRSDCPLFVDVPPKSYVYFVHSYHPVTFTDDIVAATAEYGYRFPAAIWRGNCFATQFHPEKSQHIGHVMLQNFVRL